MSEKNNKLPIGLLLQQAGLISAEQLETALELQKQYTHMKLGEILVLQQGLRVKTINFFVDKWQEIMTQGQILPLGYYLKQACLLNEQQIEIILKEQQQKQEKFGELAVKKGWIKQDTINFFVIHLSDQPPQIISLSMLEAYNSTALHLEKKYANYSLLLSRILGWTGGIPVLTKAICQVFAKSESNIPEGQEVRAVDRFIEGTLIRKWHNSKAASSIRIIADSLVNNPRCNPSLLLKEYQDILLAGEKEYQDSKEQKELLLLGLVVQLGRQVKVSNIIYQQIFNREFVIEQLNRIRQKDTNVADNNIEQLNRIKQKDANVADNNIEQLNKIKQKNTNVADNNIDSNLAIDRPNTIIDYEPQPKIIKTISPVIDQVDSQPKNVAQNVTNSVKDEHNSKLRDNTPEPLTKIGSIIIGVAIALLIPLFLTINNYYSSLSNTGKVVQNSQKKVAQLQQSCNQLSLSNLELLLNSISNLELNQQQLQQDFPSNCEVALSRLRVMAAPQLGKESRILEAIRHLCKVPPSSEMYIDAEVWLKRWYNSSNWGQETKFYLEETDKYEGRSCPAAHFTEYES